MRLFRIMENCTYSNEYAAVKASNLLRDEVYISIKQDILRDGKWTESMQQMEEELENVSVQFV